LLNLAARCNKIDIALALIQRFANVNSKNEQGWTPIATAVRCNHLGFVKLLLEYGADPSIKSKCQRSAYDLAVTVEMRKLFIRPSIMLGTAAEGERIANLHGGTKLKDLAKMYNEPSCRQKAKLIPKKKKISTVLLKRLESNNRVDIKGIMSPAGKSKL
jgi:ankyrin repeat protein